MASSLPNHFGSLGIELHYYMTTSMSGQDDPNLALWLATQAGKMELSCLLGIQALSCKENLSCFVVLSYIINPLLTKLIPSRWLDIGLLWLLELARKASSCFIYLSFCNTGWVCEWIYTCMWKIRYLNCRERNDNAIINHIFIIGWVFCCFTF